MAQYLARTNALMIKQEPGILHLFICQGTLGPADRKIQF